MEIVGGTLARCVYFVMLSNSGILQVLFYSPQENIDCRSERGWLMVSDAKDLCESEYFSTNPEKIQVS